MVSCVEITRQEDYRSKITYKMGSFQTIIFASVIEDASRQKDWRA
jgi:hypothetical protein